MTSSSSDHKIGLLEGMAYTTGGIIGSGIFVSPKGILLHTGSIGMSLLIWIVCGVKTMLSALVYIELATSIPQSGCQFSYISYVGWKPLAFAFLWLSSVIKGSCSASILVLTFGDYAASAVEQVTCLGKSERRVVVHASGALVLALFTWINFYSLRRYGARIQVLVTLAKILILGGIIGIGAWFLIVKGRTSHFTWSSLTRGSITDPGSIVLAFYSGGWAYSGFNDLGFGTEEVNMRDKRTFPLSVLGGVLLTMLLYVSANVAYFVILEPEDILHSSAVATTFVERSLGSSAAYVMPVLVGIVVGSTLNSALFISSRFMLAGARQGMMPRCVALVSADSASPRMSLIIHAVLWIACSLIGNVEILLRYLSILGLLEEAVTLSALLWIRYKNIPVNKNAIKTSIMLIIFVYIECVCNIVIPVYQNLKITLIGCGLFLIAGASYFVFEKYPPTQFRIVKRIDDAVTRFCQIIFMSVIDEPPKIE